jgi:hypothetical protein
MAVPDQRVCAGEVPADHRQSGGAPVLLGFRSGLFDQRVDAVTGAQCDALLAVDIIEAQLASVRFFAPADIASVADSASACFER